MSTGFRLFLGLVVAFAAVWVCARRLDELEYLLAPAPRLLREEPPGGPSGSPLDGVVEPGEVRRAVTLTVRGVRPPPPAPAPPLPAPWNNAAYAGDLPDRSGGSAGVGPFGHGGSEGAPFTEPPGEAGEEGWPLEDLDQAPDEPGAPGPPAAGAGTSGRRLRDTETFPGGPAAEDLPGAGLPPVRLRSYRVREGDRLWTVAARELGAGWRYREILELNRDAIRDPDVLAPGMELRLPER